ncbi:hypothetical protein BC937DRAFT_94902 [Endogone sp. FLAS-F59071]|nr:hypothetical protein BC937DRAFT_94902 [Endogone sp. FLAS-F59071]|eukprot:RUS13703.1 hypothetical protein BC937DRAFT_94902 [Endogone sp. FLAS-F59071]
MSDQTSAMLKFKVPSFGFSKLKISSPKPYVPPAPQEPGSYPDRPVTVAVIGAGTRGKSLAHYATVFPEWMTIVAVAEPNEIRRVKFSQEYSISEENVVTDWKELASRSKFCDAVFIATLDHLHCEPAIAFAELKYHILLEKPMANSIEECRAIVEAVERNNVLPTLFIE